MSKTTTFTSRRLLRRFASDYQIDGDRFLEFVINRSRGNATVLKLPKRCTVEAFEFAANVQKLMRMVWSGCCADARSGDVGHQKLIQRELGVGTVRIELVPLRYQKLNRLDTTPGELIYLIAEEHGCQVQ
ncbi:zinc finger C3HC4-type RING finger family protein [Prunus dulcis]|uniref:Zinc finger C3HC4-type RING finger family protein n=1 Tax=Prunus dulcis TaxID=3755 RepID=A0A4Y1QZU5_PRUDU|nr:zinc finger C3HC4-type RING finger family protein [Prunus dulcis]